MSRQGNSCRPFRLNDSIPSNTFGHSSDGAYSREAQLPLTTPLSPLTPLTSDLPLIPDDHHSAVSSKRDIEPRTSGQQADDSSSTTLQVFAEERDVSRSRNLSPTNKEYVGIVFPSSQTEPESCFDAGKESGSMQEMEKNPFVMPSSQTEPDSYPEVDDVFKVPELFAPRASLHTHAPSVRDLKTRAQSFMVPSSQTEPDSQPEAVFESPTDTGYKANAATNVKEHMAILPQSSVTEACGSQWTQDPFAESNEAFRLWRTKVLGSSMHRPGAGGKWKNAGVDEVVEASDEDDDKDETGEDEYMSKECKTDSTRAVSEKAKLTPPLPSTTQSSVTQPDTQELDYLNDLDGENEESGLQVNTARTPPPPTASTVDREIVSDMLEVNRDAEGSGIGIGDEDANVEELTTRCLEKRKKKWTPSQSQTQYGAWYDWVRDGGGREEGLELDHRSERPSSPPAPIPAGDDIGAEADANSNSEPGSSYSSIPDLGSESGSYVLTPRKLRRAKRQIQGIRKEGGKGELPAAVREFLEMFSQSQDESF